MSDHIIVENLVKTYGTGLNKTNALDGLSLAIKKGEFITVMGPSGSGKTTLLNMVGCLDKFTSGRLILDGIDVASMSDSEISKLRANHIGFVFQDGNLLPVLSALENVMLPMECKGIAPEKRKERAEKLLDLVELAEHSHKRPSQLSAGQKQRVAIARAFANSPSIILADEPTGNLDSENATNIMNLMKRLNEKLETTIMVVTHDDKTALFADKKIVIRDGKIEKTYTKK